MKKMLILAAATAPAAVALANLYGDLPDAKHAWAVHDMNRPAPAKVEPAKCPCGAPSDATILFDGTWESLDRNWCDMGGKSTQWKIGSEGDFYCVAGWKNGGEIRTRNKFGDCQLHIEYRHDADIGRTPSGPQMRGNSGVFLMNNYEIQVLESYFTRPEGDPLALVRNYADGQAGAVYAENPPAVNPARKPGEWQVYDIVFHQPVWKGDQLVHPGSITLFFNGVLVQDHWEMEGLTTHCRRRPLAPHAVKDFLRLQDHGCVVHYRNVWIREIPSRWDNKTHSVLSADPESVMAERRLTAAKLYKRVPQPLVAEPVTLELLMDVLAYANEGKYADEFKKLSDEYIAKYSKLDEKARAEEDKKLNLVRGNLGILIRCKVIPEDHPLAVALLPKKDK